jgi:PucR C-terminal helix-turn-helix domain
MTAMTGSQNGSGPGESEQVFAELVDYAADRLPMLVEGHVSYMLREIDGYRGDVVTRDDVRRSVEHTMRFLITAMRDPAAPRDFAAPCETGRRRARQGVPLPEVLRAYRTGMTAMWDAIIERARGTAGPAMMDALITAAGLFWELKDEYVMHLTESYRTTTADLLLAQNQRRSALAEALFTGAPGRDVGPWEVSKLLGIPPDGDLLVVAAENRGIADEGLPRIETRLTERGVTSAWRLTPALQMGVLSLRIGQLDEVLGLLGYTATGRVGVSPVFASLKDVPRALHLAKVALSRVPQGRAELKVFSSSPLAALVAQDLEEGERIAQRVLGAVLELPVEDRVVLLETLHVWFDNAGSAEQAAEKLYCHPNTVRYRLRRIQELTGRSLSEPYHVADLAAALHALRLDRS